MPDASVTQGLFSPLQHAQVSQLGPCSLLQAVEEIEIDMVALQSGKLLVEKAVAILDLLDIPDRQLRGEMSFLPVASCQGLADDRFAVAAVVHVGRVDVIHATVKGVADHLDGLGLVNVGRPFPWSEAASLRNRERKPWHWSFLKCGNSWQSVLILGKVRWPILLLFGLHVQFGRGRVEIRNKAG